MSDEADRFHGFDDRRHIIMDVRPRRRVVNVWPKVGAVLQAIGSTVLVYGLHRGDDFLMLGAILQSVGTALIGFTTRQANRSSQDQGIR